MSGQASRNLGVKIIASFEDSAIPMHTPTGLEQSGKASRSRNEGIRLLAEYEGAVLRFKEPETATVETLNGLFAQHEQKVQRLVNELQGRIEDLKKQVAELTNLLLERDRLLDRYYLDGPDEDDI